MAWRQKTIDLLGDVLRFAVRGALLVNGILIALGSCYVTGKLVWYSIRFLDRWLFAKPW
jgi:hypothetical protein